MELQIDELKNGVQGIRQGDWIYIDHPCLIPVSAAKSRHPIDPASASKNILGSDFIIGTEETKVSHVSTSHMDSSLNS